MIHLLETFYRRYRKSIYKVMTYGVGIIGVALLVWLGVFIYQNIQSNQAKVEEEQSYPAQEAQVLDNRYPTASLGLGNLYWEYTFVSPEMEYEERQQLLDQGKVTLWPTFDEENLMWFSAHYNGTFEYIGDNIRIGSIVDVTTPVEYEQRHMNDDPDILHYEIVERISTDIWAEDIFETTGERATDMYNDGTEEPMIVIQHSGEEDGEIILYLGTFVEKTNGDFVTNPLED